MTLFTDLTQAETTSDSDEFLIRQGTVYRRISIEDMRNGITEVSARTTFVELAGATTANGVLTLSQEWDAFEEIVVEYADSNSTKIQNVFYTGIVTPSDSTTVMEYMLNSNTTVGRFNFRDTNRSELYLDSIGDDDSIIKVYGRYPK